MRGQHRKFDKSRVSSMWTETIGSVNVSICKYDEGEPKVSMGKVAPNGTIGPIGWLTLFEITSLQALLIKASMQMKKLFGESTNDPLENVSVPNDPMAQPINPKKEKEEKERRFSALAKCIDIV